MTPEELIASLRAKAATADFESGPGYNHDADCDHSVHLDPQLVKAMADVVEVARVVSGWADFIEDSLRKYCQSKDVCLDCDNVSYRLDEMRQALDRFAALAGGRT